MGRRSLVQQRQMTPEQARSAVIRHFAHLNSHGGVNLAQMEAQVHEQTMVRLLADFAMDTTGEISYPLRAKCAMDVIAIARGPLREWLHTGQTVDPAAPSPDGKSTVGDNIEAAKASAAVHEELDRLVAQRINPSDWPVHVRLAVGDALSYFSERVED
jgi:hypothetical protein